MAKKPCPGIWCGAYPPFKCELAGGHRGRCSVSYADGHAIRWWGVRRQPIKVRMRQVRRHLAAIESLLGGL